MRLKHLLYGVVISALFATSLVNADDWKPDGPLSLQIGFGAGGETDTLGRVIGKVIKEQTGWDVVVENKPGGGGVAMFTAMSAGPSDGSVVGMTVNMPIMINLVLRGDKLPFKLDSFEYLGTVARAQLAIITKKDAPFDDIKGLVDYSKANKGAPVAFDAKPQELILRAINKQDDAGFKMVSTKSSAEMVQFVLGGQVMAAFSAGKHIPYVEKGDLKVLASANDGRHSYAPDVLSLREQGYDLFVDPYFFFATRSGLADDAKAALEEALANAINTDAVKEVVDNALSTDVDNKGGDGTRKMMQDGIAGVKVLFDSK